MTANDAGNAIPLPVFVRLSTATTTAAAVAAATQDTKVRSQALRAPSNKMSNYNIRIGSFNNKI